MTWARRRCPTWTTPNGLIVVRILSGVCNSHLLIDGRRALLVDTGLRAHRRRLCRHLETALAAHRTQLDYVVLSHTHFDHAANAAHLARTYGAQVIAHRSEANYLPQGQSPISPGANRLTHLIDRHAGLIARRYAYEPVVAGMIVDDELDLTDLGIRAQVIHTPGHTPGSLSVIADGGIALCGSAMLGFRPESIDLLFETDEAQKRASWRRLLANGCAWYLSSHGRPISRARLARQLAHKEQQP